MKALLSVTAIALASLLSACAGDQTSANSSATEEVVESGY